MAPPSTFVEEMFRFWKSKLRSAIRRVNEDLLILYNIAIDSYFH